MTTLSFYGDYAEVEEEMERNTDNFVLHPNVNPEQILEDTTIVNESDQIPITVTPMVKSLHVYPRHVRIPVS